MLSTFESIVYAAREGLTTLTRRLPQFLERVGAAAMDTYLKLLSNAIGMFIDKHCL